MGDQEHAQQLLNFIIADPKVPQWITDFAVRLGTENQN
jgi:hypothetical protein